MRQNKSGGSRMAITTRRAVLLGTLAAPSLARAAQYAG